jgi:hypothetical protein
MVGESMDVAEIGSICIGIVICYFTMIFVTRFNDYTVIGLSGIVTIIIGGTVLDFLQKGSFNFWYYSIGVFVGLVIYQIIYTIYYHEPFLMK